MTALTKRQPRRSPFVDQMIADYADMPDIKKLQRALEDGNVDAAIAIALGKR